MDFSLGLWYLVFVMKADYLRRVVVSFLAVAMSVCVAQGQVVEMGKDFVNVDGVKMDFRKKSTKGNAFWRSEAAPLVGLGKEGQTTACLNLTKRARAAGRLPEGYAYFPNQGYDGKYVLIKMEELGVGNEPFAISSEKAGFFKSPFAPGKGELDLSDTARYPSGGRVICPFTGKIFRKP